jgi:CMP-N-acetylneuraminic acid synthetase
MFEIERLQAVDIDEELDFKVAELLYKELQNIENHVKNTF